MTKPLLVIGVMTGNSVDGADTVLTAFYPDGRIEDLCSHFLPFDDTLYQPIRALQSATAQAQGNMRVVANTFSVTHENEVLTFDEVHNRYIHTIAKAVNELVTKAQANTDIANQFDCHKIDAIGLHGQTCDHCPPSRVGGFHPEKVYTVQIGNGQQLADLTGITVIYDFRSDDIMAGGEGAPLAPIHNKHLAEHAQSQGLFPVTFCNAGNTGNVAPITHSIDDPKAIMVVGWDTGPFNHYPDWLMRKERGYACDMDGSIGQTGKVNLDLLRLLFNDAVAMENGDNYLLKNPPKSGDPNYYQPLSDLVNPLIPFEDRLRTVEYFSVYVMVHSLSLTPTDIVLPTHFVLFGGGWSNPVVLEHFNNLLAHDLNKSPILLEHEIIFQQVQDRFKKTGKKITVDFSDTLGFQGKVMEARIFADMARCRLIGRPFSTPDTTGVHQPVVSGIIRFPNGNKENATEAVLTLIEAHPQSGRQIDNPDTFEPRWSRASSGWQASVNSGT